MSSRCEWRDRNGTYHVWTYTPRDAYLNDRVIGDLLAAIDTHKLDGDDEKLKRAASNARLTLKGGNDE